MIRLLAFGRLQDVTTADSVVRIMSEFSLLLTKTPRPSCLLDKQDYENSM